MTRKKRLGRGLEALLNVSAEPATEPTSEVAVADRYELTPSSNPGTSTTASTSMAEERLIQSI